nr:MAG TPA: hypothetical protein [Crassvirales sp.]
MRIGFAPNPVNQSYSFNTNEVLYGSLLLSHVLSQFLLIII